MTVLRPARDMDTSAVGAILSGFIDETPWMPRIHSRAEDLAHAAQLIARGWVTVAEEKAAVVGFAAQDGDDLDALYVASDMQGMGVGSALVSDLQRRRPRLVLWTFQANTRAQTFYVRHGFIEVDRTDGQRNDEQLPDVKMIWEREAG